MGFHPVRDFEEASVVVTSEHTFLALPAEVCDRANLVDTVFDMEVVVNFKLVDGVFEVDFVDLSQILGAGHLEDKIEI